MDQLRVLVAAKFRQNSRRVRIDPKSLIALGFAKIDIGKRSGVDQKIEIDRAQFPAHLIAVCEIELRVVKTNNAELFSIRANERGA